MSPIEHFKQRLEQRSDIRWTDLGQGLRIEAARESGFAIEVRAGDGGVQVTFGDGWHENFATEEQALDCVGFGLSRRCRLREERCGETPYRWTVEQCVEMAWRPVSTTGLIFFPFWRRRSVRILQNDLLDEKWRDAETDGRERR